MTENKWIVDGHHYTCPDCKKTIAIVVNESDEGFDFCPFCGKRMSDQMAENKTCPFCGSDRIEVYTHYGESAGIQYGGYYPECTVCGCRLNYHDSREEALKAWNERDNHGRE